MTTAIGCTCAVLDVAVVGANAFEASLDAWLDACEELVAHAARGIAVDAFHQMLRISPQFSGDFVANWNVSVDAPDESFTPWGSIGHGRPGFVNVRVGGDPAAIGEAVTRNLGRASAFALGQSIYITNASHHDEFYAGLIEDNQIRFRPGNAGAVIARTVADIVSAYRDLSAAEATTLAQKVF